MSQTVSKKVPEKTIPITHNSSRKNLTMHLLWNKGLTGQPDEEKPETLYNIFMYWCFVLMQQLWKRQFIITAGMHYLKSPNNHHKIVRAPVKNIHNPRNCNFKIHCAGLPPITALPATENSEMKWEENICNKVLQNWTKYKIKMLIHRPSGGYKTPIGPNTKFNNQNLHQVNSELKLKKDSLYQQQHSRLYTIITNQIQKQWLFVMNSKIKNYEVNYIQTKLIK